MTPPDDSPTPAQNAPQAASEASAGDPADGRWVWQYGAPPPPPSFGARLFAANASPEFLRFAFCALLVIVGCLLPWGPEEAPALAGLPAAESVDAGDAAAEPGTTWLVPPVTPGAHLPLGAVSLMLGLWLLYAALAGAYSGRHRILPVVLMIEPVVVTLEHFGAAMDAAGDEGFLRAIELAGSGVLLTFLGAAFMTLQFFFLLGKVFAKKDDKGGGARRSKGGKDGADGKSAKGGKARAGRGKDKAGADAGDKPGKDAAPATTGDGDGDPAKAPASAS